MANEAYVAVEYIGGLPEKRDNIVPGSGNVWKGKHSYVRVPERESHKYIHCHPDEFRLLTPLFLESPAAEVLSKDDQIYAMLSIASNLELHAAEELLVAVQARIKELGEDRGRAQVSAKDRPRFNERQKKISDAIARMDPTDATHYTDLGKPRVSMVNRMSGLGDVASAEIAEVQRQEQVVTRAAA